MTEADALVTPDERQSEPNPSGEQQTTPILTVESNRVDGTDVLTLHGEIDMSSAPDLELALDGLGPEVVVDMRDVGFMDSSGIAVLVRASSDGRRIRIHASRPVSRILDVTGLDDTFEVVVDGSGPATPSPDL